MTARQFLYKHIKAEMQEYFGVDEESFLSHVCDAWMNDESNSKHRYDAMISFLGEDTLKHSSILDIASGCGTFVFYGLLNGYDVTGIEPEVWKHQFNSLKSKENGYPDSWIRKFHNAVGEQLPFRDESFDIISTYQTLEHVQSHRECFAEFKRVLKQGGVLFIQCPDYNSFFESHYRIPMLPHMNRVLFKRYLALLGRPTKGLDAINYITRRMVIDYLGRDYDIYDVGINNVRRHVHRRMHINSTALARVYSLYSTVRKIGREESSVHIIGTKI